MTDHKNNFFLIVGLSFCLFLGSCSPVPPSYKYKDIADTIEGICQREFQVKLTVYPLEDTIWIYAPFKDLLTEDNTINEKKQKKIRNIFLSLRRTVLSTEKPPLFYILVASNIENQGADIYYIGFVPDIVKFELHFISRDQFNNRIIMFSFMNPQALGDKSGKHIATTEMTMGYFIAYLTRQRLMKFYSEEKTNIEELKVSYKNRTIEVSTNIKRKNKNQPKPFTKTKEIIKNLLTTYQDFINDVALVEIEDKDNGLKRIYSIKTLLSE
jgi:hypothetical protein